MTTDAASTKIRRYCAFQERTESEVRKKLLSYSLPQEQIDKIIDELKKESFIDDNRFTENFIRSKLTNKQWGKVKITAKLKEKGIDNQIIQSHLRSMTETDFQEAIRNTIEKWLRSHELNKVSYPKLYRFLASKGFEQELIIKSLKDYAEED